MATDWYMEGSWFKNCNCDPGCPCDFNQNPTHGNCQAMVAMRVDRGTYGDLDLTGLKWATVARWPGPIHEGNGEIQPFIDESADEKQREALLTILSGQAGDTWFEIFSVVCPTVHEPVFAPIEFEFDLESRKGRVRIGDGLVESEVETLRGIDPPDPYRVIVKIPNGFEYTGPDESAETALARRIRSRGPIELDLKDSHSSMAYVRHSNTLQRGAVPHVGSA
jgi:hypothetical protein